MAHARHPLGPPANLGDWVEVPTLQRFGEKRVSKNYIDLGGRGHYKGIWGILTWASGTLEVQERAEKGHPKIPLGREYGFRFGSFWSEMGVLDGEFNQGML